MRNVFLALFLIASVNVCAQEELANTVKSIIPPAPTTAALAKYVEVPVDYYTGLPKIEMPLYRIKDNDLEIPIYLSYNAGGHKVAETPGWVGLGWSLNAGGVITRLIQGEDDLFSPYGYMYSGANLSKVMDADPVYGDVASENTWGRFLSLDNDPEPDIFYFNFGSFSGKFIVTPEKKPVVFSKQKLKIECVFSYIETFNREALSSFVITDNEGIKYTFSDIEYQRVKTYGSYTSGTNVVIIPPIPSKVGANGNAITYQVGSIAKTSISAWYLSSVETPNGVRAYFTYEDEISEDYKNGSFFYGKVSHGPLEGNDWVEGFGNYIENHSKRLSKINWSAGNIAFDADEIRKDLSTPSNNTASPARALTGININVTGRLIKKYSLIHSYMRREVSDHLVMELRLQLDKLREYSINDSQQYVDYTFEYNPGSLPSRDSYNADFWGYANWGVTSFMPNLYKYANRSDLYPNYYSILPKRGSELPIARTTDGADREPDVNYARMGILNKIIYPTGGYTKFSYELNDFFLDGNVFTAGGFRIKMIETSDGTSKAPITRVFDYKDPTTGLSSGRIVNLPVFGDKMVALNTDNFEGDPARYSITQSELQGTKGSYVGYEKVIETSVNSKGETLGQVIRSYSFPGSYGVSEDGCNGTDCAFKVIPIKYFSFSKNYPHLTLEEYKNWGLAFPKIPNYDWNRGFLLEEVIKNRSGKIVKDVNYTYNTIDSWHVEKIPGIAFRKFTGVDVGWTFAYSRYYLTSGWRYLYERKETNYSDIGSPMESITRYYYDNYDHMQLTKKESVNSDHSLSTKLYFYALDIPSDISTPTDVVSFMNERHIVSPVLKEEDYRGTKMIDGTKMNYSFNSPFTDRIVCSSVEKYFGDKYENYMFLDRYDSQGNLLQFHKNGDYVTSSILGLSGQERIANCINASYGSWLDYSFNDNKLDGVTASSGVSLYNCPEQKEIIVSRIYGGQYNHVDYTVDSKVLKPNTKYVVEVVGKIVGFTNAGIKVIDGSSQVSSIFNASEQWRSMRVEFSTSNQPNSILVSVRNNVDGATTASGSFYISEIRVYPYNAKITSYTWLLGVGMTSQTNADGEITFYEYDGFNRLFRIKDKSGNVLNQYDYHYANQ